MIAQELKRVRRVGTPLVAIITADQPNTVAQIRENFNGKSGALLTWDVIRGYSPLNELGTDAKVALEATHDAMALTNFTEAMIAALDLPSKTCVLVQNGHAFLGETNPIQALLNLRDFFKSTERTIVLLGPDFKMPAELAQDILVLTEELPSPQEIRATLDKLCSDNALDCDDDTRAHLIELHDVLAGREILAERAFLRELGAGCSLPVAAHATARADQVHVSAVMAHRDGVRSVRAERNGDDPEVLGTALAAYLRDERGGAALVG